MPDEKNPGVEMLQIVRVKDARNSTRFKSGKEVNHVAPKALKKNSTLCNLGRVRLD